MRAGAPQGNSQVALFWPNHFSLGACGCCDLIPGTVRDVNKNAAIAACHRLARDQAEGKVSLGSPSIV